MLLSANESNSPMLAVEMCATALTAAVAFAWPRLGASSFAAVERAFGRLARRKGLAVLSVGLSVLMLRLAMLPLFPIPIPFVPDDFSFLLASDTFIHGRLTNPTPAMWIHFESIHITMLPTYMSMYFPGQGLLLAAGKVLFGEPWFALLIASALACAALCWMLQAWVPANWALLGGFIAVIRLGVFSDWINTYHTGGALGALAGALVLGGLPRLMKTGRFYYGLLMGAGMAILVLTRPYEGMLLCLPVTVAVAWWAMKGKNRPPAAVLLRRAALPAALVIATVGWLGYYDLKAFGKATTLPYTLDRAQYAVAPYYVWQPQNPTPAYRHEAMRRFYQVDEMDFFNSIHSWKGFLPHTLEKVRFTVLFYAGHLLLLPMLMLRRVFLDQRIRFLVICTLVLAAGMVIEVYLLPHYVAPFAAAFYAIGIQAMRHLRLWKPEGKPVGLAMVRWTVFCLVALAGVRLFAEPLHLAPAEFPASNWNFTWFGPEHFGTVREAVKQELEQLQGGQLALVRYGKKHNPLDEWVYNSPDIDDSKVVWAREMNAADNQELLRYYKDRKVWLVEPDAIPARITPYVVPKQAVGAAE